MKTYYFEVMETLSKMVAVEAEDFDEAYEIVEEAFNGGQKEITWDDFVSRDIEDKTYEIESCISYGYTDYVSRFEKIKKE